LGSTHSPQKAGAPPESVRERVAGARDALGLGDGPALAYKQAVTDAELPDRPSCGRRSFERVLSARLSRRGVLSGTLGGAAAFLSIPGVAEGQAPLVGFTPLPASAARGVMPAIAPEYEYQVLIPWGEPLVPGGP